MPYDKVKNQRKGFCFVTFDCMQAVTEILKTPKHVINGKQVNSLHKYIITMYKKYYYNIIFIRLMLKKQL